MKLGSEFTKVTASAFASLIIALAALDADAQTTSATPPPPADKNNSLIKKTAAVTEVAPPLPLKSLKMPTDKIFNSSPSARGRDQINPFPAYILVRVRDGAVMASNHPDEILEPASTTKLANANEIYLELNARAAAEARQIIERTPGMEFEAARHQAMEKLLAEPVEITSSDLAQVDQRKCLVKTPDGGKGPSVEELIRMILVYSCNDAAVRGARFAAGSEHAQAQRMNATADRLGIGNVTIWRNVSGLPPTNSTIEEVPGVKNRKFGYNATTPRGLTKIMDDFVKNTPPELKKLNLKNVYVPTKRQVMPNTNSLFNEDKNKRKPEALFIDEMGIEVTDSKTGTTSIAGSCVVMRFVYNGEEYDYAVMGAAGGANRSKDFKDIVARCFNIKPASFAEPNIAATQTPATNSNTKPAASGSRPGIEDRPPGTSPQTGPGGNRRGRETAPLPKLEYEFEPD